MTSFVRKLFGHFLIPASIPFRLEEFEDPNEQVIQLFKRSFCAPPPTYPRHFAAIHEDHDSPAAYVHYTVYEPGVFLVGGLCVDTSVYRKLNSAQRKAVAKEGSLSRWVLARSIERLGQKRAIFAYTGNISSRRDVASLGFVIAAEPYLSVQWHDEPESTRNALTEGVKSLGPF